MLASIIATKCFKLSAFKSKCFKSSQIKAIGLNNKDEGDTSVLLERATELVAGACNRVSRTGVEEDGGGRVNSGGRINNSKGIALVNQFDSTALRCSKSWIVSYSMKDRGQLPCDVFENN